MDFYRILEVEKQDRQKNDYIEIFPDFQVSRSSDLMIRGKDFYAIWDPEKGLWSTDEYDVQRLVDQALLQRRDEVKARVGHNNVKIQTLGNYQTQLWTKFKSYCKNLSDNYEQLDRQITFANSSVEKEDYVSKRLVYEISRGSTAAFDELLGELYEEDQRAKLLWAIGAIVAGDARDIQKFIVLYGPPGAGKGTVIAIIQQLFDGYVKAFDAKALTSNSNAFSTEVFRDNPLVGIQHDGDLSRIEDNTKLNSIVSHEIMSVNEKHKSSYDMVVDAFLFMGSNKAVKITDSKSGLIRRLIDVHPTGRKIPERKYHVLMGRVKFELGAIAAKCLEVYQDMGREYYSGYRPVEMMFQTDVFYNYVDYYFDILSDPAGVSLDHAYTLYKRYCTEALLEWKLPLYKFREELKNYYKEFHDRYDNHGTTERGYFIGFIDDNFQSKVDRSKPISLILDKEHSEVDQILRDCPAQYSKADGSPARYWTNRERLINGVLREPDPSSVCDTVLSDLDTRKEHYVKPPLNHIVIDFDLKGEDGLKSAELNLEAAAKWPATYAEYSKGGAGIHLHYFYDGDPTELSRIFGEGIEIKVFVGDASLRRRLSFCNDIPIATINSGLPLKEKKVISDTTIESEKGLRTLVIKNLNKGVHPATKPSMDFIKKILDDAYDSGLDYDLSDLKPNIIKFASASSNQNLYCLKLVKQLKLTGPNSGVDAEPEPDNKSKAVQEMHVFDMEVFPNLLTIGWKTYNKGGKESIVRLVNPSPAEVEQLVRTLNLVGFNNRRYDNHILYARIMGYNNEQIFQLSKRIVETNRGGFGEAYNLSYADIYDFAATKQGLKKWMIELGLPHLENKLPWDQPVPEDKIQEVLDYQDNDVMATEAVLSHLWSDFNARLMMAELSGLPVNDTLRAHATQIILEGDKRAKNDEFVYTDLSQDFPGYEFELGKSTFRDVEVGEGGLVNALPGMYQNVAVLDIESMHPNSLIQLNHFGKYTKNFKAILDARVAIKNGDFDAAKRMFDGRLEPFLGTVDDAEKLSYALKIIINSIYGFTAASFDNPFRDPRNKDNIVAKRGALFMVLLKEVIEDHGYQLIHTKTDSVKIPNADKKIIDIVMEFGLEWGYKFVHEATYEKFCLVNKAVYVAYVQAGRKPAHWEAVGTEFQRPYVFKKLFTKEPIVNVDLCETKQVTTSMYLDFTPETDAPMALLPDDGEPDPEDLVFVGKIGSFVPVANGGGYLLREKEGKLHAVTGSSGHKWRETSSVEATDSWGDVDYTYFNRLADDAIANISQYGDFEWFVADSNADERLVEAA